MFMVPYTKLYLSLKKLKSQMIELKRNELSLCASNVENDFIGVIFERDGQQV